jgi:hypothetical protein
MFAVAAAQEQMLFMEIIWLKNRFAVIFRPAAVPD